MKKLPKTLYGYWDGSKGEEFVNTTDDANATVETGETKRVGVYELVGYAQVVNETKTTLTRTQQKSKR